MKKLERLKLNQLSRKELKKRELNQIRGGGCCGCGCNYQFEEGSSVAGNYGANSAGGLVSYGVNLGCNDGLPVPSGGTCSKE